MSRICFVLFALAAAAQTLPPGVQKKASVGGITEYDYPNGLKVLLYPDPANPKVTVNVAYLVGSRHEGYGETGMAHLLEHLDFIETTNGRQIKNEIVAHGANWNGTTSYDRTNYYETVTATDENLKWALGLEADRMVQREVHQADSRHGNDRGAQRVRTRREQPAIDPFASAWRPRLSSGTTTASRTIGSKDDIESVPVDRLEAFYHKFYQPDNAVLVITGRLDEARPCNMSPIPWANFRGPRANWSRPTPSSRRRTANASWNCAAWARDRK